MIDYRLALFILHQDRAVEQWPLCKAAEDFKHLDKVGLDFALEKRIVDDDDKMLVAVHAQFAFLEDADKLGVFLLHPVEHFLPEGLEFLEGERWKMLGMGFERCEIGRGDCGGLDADA